jgi:hypothetical protein
MGQEEFDGVADAFASGGGNVTILVSEMVHCRSDLEARDPVVGPRAAFLWSFMDDDFAARWCKGSFFEVKHAPQLVVRRPFWVKAR